MSEEGRFAGRRRKQRRGPRTRPVEASRQPFLETTPEKIIGLIEWFRPGEHGKVERILADCEVLGVKALRTAVSWADWHTPAGQAWYSWFIPHLAAKVDLLPCFLYTPPSLGVEPKTAAPPRNPQAYADFLDQMITLFGAYFEWVELWNEPNNLLDWEWRLDPKWRIFTDMMGRAAYWAQYRGKKTVLAGMCPMDPHWLALMCERGLMHHIDAVGVHGFPGTWEFDWVGWPANLAKVREVLNRYKVKPELWITETGYSTWRHDERGQLQAFAEAIAAPVDRLYWYSAHDLHPDLPHQEGFHADERHYHFGLKRADGTPKLLFRLAAKAGLAAQPDVSWLGDFPVARQQKRRQVLITGGAGFIGTSVADRLLTAGHSVLVFDNLSRHGVEQNLRWLRQRHGPRLQMVVFRMSCIYGLHQFGTEDQGWVAHFLIRALEGQPITLYGDGRQVRDILFIDDLVEALLLAQKQMPKLSGQAFNIGGGPAQAVSLLELIELIAELHGKPPVIHLGDWRPGDQRYYVSDTRRFREATGWAPRVGVRQGLRRLYRWLLESHDQLAPYLPISEVAS